MSILGMNRHLLRRSVALNEVVVTGADARRHNMEKRFAFLQGVKVEISDKHMHVGSVKYSCFHRSPTELYISGKVPQQCVHPQEIAPATKTGDNPQTHWGQH
jgi:hypothetical protein